jgi:hypothetical protein
MTSCLRTQEEPRPNDFLEAENFLALCRDRQYGGLTASRMGQRSYYVFLLKEPRKTLVSNELTQT